jgi:hypothetical protein
MRREGSQMEKVARAWCRPVERSDRPRSGRGMAAIADLAMAEYLSEFF